VTLDAKEFFAGVFDKVVDGEDILGICTSEMYVLAECVDGLDGVRLSYFQLFFVWTLSV